MGMADCHVCRTRITYSDKTTLDEATDEQVPNLIVHLSEDPVTRDHEPELPPKKPRKKRPAPKG